MSELNESGTGQKLKIETTAKGDSEISLCPERGGIVTSIKLKGKEILYLDEGTFNDLNVNVRGGIPVLFPNAGAITEGVYGLKQHGFARISKEWIINTDNSGELNETLWADDVMKQAFPFDFSLSIKNKLEDDGSITLIQEAINLETEKDMPISMGLHPYFYVPKDRKNEMEFDFAGGEIIKNEFAIWSNGGVTTIDNPKVMDPNAVLRVSIPEVGMLLLDISPEYQKIWIWSLPDKDFICIEPAMRAQGGLIDDPELVKPGQAFSGRVNFRLE